MSQCLLSVGAISVDDKSGLVKFMVEEDADLFRGRDCDFW